MRVKLSKTQTIKKYQTETSGLEQRITYRVDYYPNTFQVELTGLEIMEIGFFEPLAGVTQYSILRHKMDALELFAESLPSLEKDIQKMDWESEYHHYQEERRMSA